MNNCTNANSDLYKVIFVLGPPGSGKNTQCDKLKEKFNLVHFSAGDLLREEVNNKESKDGELINGYIKAGTIVPVRITCRLIKNAMEKSGGTKNNYIVDGFPRNKENLEGWLDTFKESCKILCVILLECSENVCSDRILNRGTNSGRADDNKEVLLKRFGVFNTETMPNILEMEKFTKVLRVNAENQKDDVFKEISEKISILLK